MKRRFQASESPDDGGGDGGSDCRPRSIDRIEQRSDRAPVIDLHHDDRDFGVEGIPGLRADSAVDREGIAALKIAYGGIGVVAEYPVFVDPLRRIEPEIELALGVTNVVPLHTLKQEPLGFGRGHRATSGVV